jgi:hypothetical protein
LAAPRPLVHRITAHTTFYRQLQAGFFLRLDEKLEVAYCSDEWLLHLDFLTRRVGSVCIDRSTFYSISWRPLKDQKEAMKLSWLLPALLGGGAAADLDKVSITVGDKVLGVESRSLLGKSM